MNEMEAWVDFYEQNNLTYFPLFGILNGVCRCPEGAKCGNAGKHPRGRWKDLPSRMPSSTDNVGISTDNLIVIDLDGDVSKEVLSEYSPTFTTSTGHGFHLWYRASKDKQIKSFVGWKHKVDIRAIGGLVVGPPSRHRSGSSYRAINDERINHVPQRLLQELPERTSAQRSGKIAMVELTDTPPIMYPMVAKLIRDVLNWTDSRNKTVFFVFCRYFEFAADNLLGMDAMQEIHQAAIEIGLTPDEIHRTMESARRSI